MGSAHEIRSQRVRAVILAAGNSTRLAPVSGGKSKELLTVGSKAIIEHQIDLLHECEVIDLVVVVGHCADEVQARVGDEVRYIHNPRYGSTNNIYSLWCARAEIVGYETICMHGDVLFHVDTLAKLLARQDDVCLVIDRTPDEETMRVKIEDGRVVGVNKKIPYAGASGTFIGVARFSQQAGYRLVWELDMLVRAGQTGGYFTDAIEAMIKKGESVGFSTTDGLPWVDIDSPEDLRRAREEIYPLLVSRERLIGNGAERCNLEAAPRECIQ